MSIEYVEIRGGDLALIGFVDTAKSIIWHSKYFGIGDFEIYVQASREIVALLQVGNYVTRPDDLEVGIIETISVADNAQDGTMLTASGRFAKSLLERRLIYNLSGTVNSPTILRGNVETEVRRVVAENAIFCATKNNIFHALAYDIMCIFKIVIFRRRPIRKDVRNGGLTCAEYLPQEPLLSRIPRQSPCDFQLRSC